MRFGNTRPQPVLRSWRLEPRLLAVPVVPDRRVAKARGPDGSGNIFNDAVYANPQNSITSGTFGQITGIAGDAALTNASYRERQMRLGVRFTF